MSVHSKFRIGLLSLLLTAGSSGAFADVSFEDVAAGTFSGSSLPPLNSFITGGSFKVNVDFGTAIVDVGGTGTVLAGHFLSPPDRFSDNTTKALYVFDSGKVTLSAPGYIMNVTSFDAAIASVLDSLAPLLDFTSNTDILVTGWRNPHFGGGTVLADFSLSPPGNELFANQLLSGFTNLDSLSFEFNSAATVCGDGCSSDFAIDNIVLTTAICDSSLGGNVCSNPSPPTINTPVPEPETYAMLLAGLGVLGLVARRRKQKEAGA